MESELESIFEGRKHLTAAFIKAFFVHNEYSSYLHRPEEFLSAGPSFKFSQGGSEDYSWTCGGNPDHEHMRVLGSGGYGQVHEVLMLSRTALTVDTK